MPGFAVDIKFPRRFAAATERVSILSLRVINVLFCRTSFTEILAKNAAALAVAKQEIAASKPSVPDVPS